MSERPIPPRIAMSELEPNQSWPRGPDGRFLRVVDAIARFWSLVDRSGDCWLWTGHRTPNGYGWFWYGGGQVLAHRFAYYGETLADDPDLKLPPLDHLCRTRPCVRPSHLEPTTSRENTLRGVGRAAVNARKTVCLRGHPFDEYNTQIDKRGHRHCRVCRRIRRRGYGR